MTNFTKLCLLFCVLLVLTYFCMITVFSPRAWDTSRVEISYSYSRWEPKPYHVVNPTYPRQAYKKGIRGHVIVRILLDEDGEVKSAQVVKSRPRKVFDKAATKAVKKWKFPVPEDKFYSYQNFVTIRFDLAP